MPFKSIDDILHFETASGELVKIGKLHSYADDVPAGEFHNLGNTRFFAFNCPDRGLVIFECEVTEDLAELKIYEESKSAAESLSS